MKIFVLFLLLIGINAKAELTSDELHEVFINSETSYGPLELDKLQKIEESLYDLGLSHIFDELKDKLGIYELEGISAYIQTCQTERDILGTYQRGRSNYTTKTKSLNMNPYDIMGFWKNQNLLEAINNAYKHYIVQNGSYVSIVILEWPVICIRPGEELGNTLETFVHEVTHYIGDSEKDLDLVEYEDEAEYVTKKLMISGGEFEAYMAGAGVQTILQNNYAYGARRILMRYFNEYGELINENDLATYILDELDYRSKFINEYRKQLANQHNEAIRKNNMLNSFYETYEKNLAIVRNNLRIDKKNIEVYQHNMKYYQKRNNIVKVNEMKNKLHKAQQSLVESEKAVRFYSELILLAEADRELTKKRISDFEALKLINIQPLATEKTTEEI